MLYVDPTREPECSIGRGNWLLPLETADGRKCEAITSTNTIRRLAEFGALSAGIGVVSDEKGGADTRVPTDILSLLDSAKDPESVDVAIEDLRDLLCAVFRARQPANTAKRRSQPPLVRTAGASLAVLFCIQLISSGPRLGAKEERRSAARRTCCARTHQGAQARGQCSLHALRTSVFIQGKPMQTYKTATLGAHKGAPRLWIEGYFPERAGFEPGTKYEAIKNDEYVVLRLAEDGKRVVSSKVTRGRTIPVIDLNSHKLLDIFPEGSALRLVMKPGEIVIAPLASEKRRQARTRRLAEKLQRNEPLSVGALAYGGGVLDHALHAGLVSAGVKASLKVANEIRDDMAEQAALHNETFERDTIALVAPLQEVVFDERAMAQLPKVDILTAGLPCSGASVAGRAKRGLSQPEQHPLVGHLVAAAVAFIAKVNPSVFVLENVPQYANTASAAILRSQLRDLHYDVHEREFLATEWGDLEKRKRWCMVAVTRGIPFDLEALLPKPFELRPLSSILEPLEAVADRWSEMKGLKAKQERDKAAGKGFMMQIYDGSETEINTLTKGITKNRSTDPKIRHPDNPDLLRIPTAREHARCKGVPEHLIEGLSQTLAHELLGQGICYAPFKALGAHLGRALKKFGEEAAKSLDGLQTAAPQLKVAG